MGKGLKMGLLSWHKNVTEKLRLYFGLSHYSLYWLAFIEGVIVTYLFLLWFH